MSNFVKKNVIMDAEAMRRAIVRISHEIIERNKGVDNVVIVGIRTRGVPIAERLAAAIKDIENVELPVGMLDITLYRDDLSTLAYNPIVHGTEIDLDLNGKTVILVDDVLYTGRTIRAALDLLWIWAVRRLFSWQYLLTADIASCRFVLTLPAKMFLPPIRKLSMYTWQRKTALMK
jgi:pyrimidine operon attenuation protein/uracil phosphoribosyltransferase